MSIEYNIIGTGSSGNCVIIENKIVIDAGVSFKSIEPYYKQFKLVLLTHEHTDHFNRSTIRRLASERPTLRFGAGAWMVPKLIEANVPKKNIDVYEPGKTYKYKDIEIVPFKLQHNVPNMGYKLHLPSGKAVYATDTCSLDCVEAFNYDLYMIEANYEDEEIQERIRAKEKAGEYAYEYIAMLNHLSKAKCDKWVYENAGPNSEYVYMHQHKERGVS